MRLRSSDHKANHAKVSQEGTSFEVPCRVTDELKVPARVSKAYLAVIESFNMF